MNNEIEENKENQKQEAQNFILYNNTIATINAINTMGNMVGCEMQNGAIFGTLASIYNNKTVYNKVMEYLQENNLYQKYARAIFELQYSGASNQEQYQSSKKLDKDSDNKSEPRNDSNIATKSLDTTITPKGFIDKYFKTDDSDGI